MINFEIQHKPLREVVYEQLKMQILTGGIDPGERMMEVALSEQLGVSRTPVREAIRKLEKEGLVTIEPRRGAYVSTLSKDYMAEVLDVRRVLESYASYLATPNMNAERFEELKEAANEYVTAAKNGDTKVMISADTKFHEAICLCCGNTYLTHTISQMQESVLRFRYLYYDNIPQGDAVAHEHQAILDAFETGNPVEVREAVNHHIQMLKTRFVSE